MSGLTGSPVQLLLFSGRGHKSWKRNGMKSCYTTSSWGVEKEFPTIYYHLFRKYPDSTWLEWSLLIYLMEKLRNSLGNKLMPREVNFYLFLYPSRGSFILRLFMGSPREFRLTCSQVQVLQKRGCSNKRIIVF